MDTDYVQEELDKSNLVIGFNLKFDIHWGRRIGLNFTGKNLWDVQLAYFMLNAQKPAYPALDFVCQQYGVPGKLDVVKTEYWEKGIDTDKVPKEILLEYMKQDIMSTYQCYLKQVEEFKAKPKLYSLFQFHCKDLEVLEEMEWNGLRIDFDLCAKKTKEIYEKIQAMEARLANRFPNIPINWDSGDHCSAILYGGTISEVRKEPDGYFKSGQRIGQPKFKNVEYKYELAGLFKPIKGSELKKGDVWSTDESVLRMLKGNKSSMEVVSIILERSKLGKLLDYYEGWPLKAIDKDWPNGEIHGLFNQCVVPTGRLSSSEPNLQNVAGECQEIIITRY